MIDFYTFSTFNGRRVAIMLEETGLRYQAHRVDLLKGEQRQPEFLKLNPSGRIPVIVDSVDEAEPLVITQSVAILQYLADKTGLLIPETLAGRAKMYEWLNFHAIDIGSTQFSAFYLRQRVESKQPEAAALLTERIVGLYDFFDQQLQDNRYFAGDEYSLADITIFPAAKSMQDSLSEYEHLMRWFQDVESRPAVQRGMKVAERGL